MPILRYRGRVSQPEEGDLMGYKAYDKAEEKYRADVKRLTSIAVKVSFDDHSLFMNCLANAWLQADKADQRILKPAWEAIITKYKLAEEVEG